MEIKGLIAHEEIYKETQETTHFLSIFFPLFLIIITILFTIFYGVDGLFMCGILFLPLLLLYIPVLFGIYRKWNQCFRIDDQGIWLIQTTDRKYLISWSSIYRIKLTQQRTFPDHHGSYLYPYYIAVTDSKYLIKDHWMGNVKKNKVMCIPYNEETKKCMEHYLAQYKDCIFQYDLPDVLHS